MHAYLIMSQRIFIGGIPPQTTSEELAQRFKSFGDVQAVELAPDKVYPPSVPGSEPIRFSRNFGHVSLIPKDEKALNRAIGVYNGSSWRGCTLRCKLAKPTMMDKLKKEADDEDAKLTAGKVKLFRRYFIALNMAAVAAALKLSLPNLLNYFTG